jgi:DNA-binding NarL/FixJ family response regulator
MTAGLSSMLGDRRDLRLSAPPVQGGTAPRGALLYDVGAPPSSYVDLVRQSRSAGWVVLALAWPEESRRELRQPTGPAPDAWLPKDVRAAELASAIVRAVRRTPRVSGPSSASPSADGLDLSERECQMLVLIAAGLSNQEIAERCYLSINSVKTFIRGAYRKIGVHRRTQAVTWVLDHGLDKTGSAENPPGLPAA